MLEKTIKIVGIISTIVAILLGIWNDILKDQNKNLTNNLHSIKVEYDNEKGQHVTEVTELRLTKSELETIIKKKDSQLSDFERKVKQVTDEMASQKTKLKNIQGAGLISLQTKLHDTVYLRDTIKAFETVKQAEILTGIEKINLEYHPLTDSLIYDFELRNDIYFAIIRKCKQKDNGKDHWPRWGKIWGWDYVLQVKGLDTSTIVKDAMYIKNISF